MATARCGRIARAVRRTISVGCLSASVRLPGGQPGGSTLLRRSPPREALPTLVVARARAMTLRMAWLGVSCAVLLCCGGKSAEPPQARLEPQSFALKVVASGSGAVISAPAGIDCGQTCSAKFAAGTQVALA